MAPMSISNKNRVALLESSTLEKLFIVIFIIVIGLNIIKPLIEFYCGINHQVLTEFQYVVLILFYVIIKVNRFTFSCLEWSLLFYLFVRYIIEIFVFGTGFMQPTISLAKFIILILGINYFVNKKDGGVLSQKLSGILWLYFVFTILISLLQLTHLHIGEIFANYGGNVMSGNIFGITRCTGGIGGTAIDYAGLIVLYTLLYTTYKNNGVWNYVYLFCLIIASLLVFSRIVFLVFLLLLFLYIMDGILTGDKKIILIISSVIAMLISISMTYDFDKYNNIVIYDAASMESDAQRFIQWNNVFKDLENTNYIIGDSMGRNTGFPGEEVGGRKIVADGHLQGFVSDFGIIGLLLYVMYIIGSIYKAINRKKETIIFVLVLFASMIINSSFDKPFNMCIYPIILFIVRQNFLMQRKENYHPFWVSLSQSRALSHNTYR